MGQYVSTAISDKQAEMMAQQTRNMALGQERMRRTMMAYQIAAARERFWWMGSTYAVVLAGLAGAARSGRPVAPVAFPPLFVAGVVVAYNWDFAYGSKPERITNMFNSLANDPSRCWYPLQATSLVDDELEIVEPAQHDH